MAQRKILPKRFCSLGTIQTATKIKVLVASPSLSIKTSTCTSVEADGAPITHINRNMLVSLVCKSKIL